MVVRWRYTGKLTSTYTSSINCCRIPTSPWIRLLLSKHLVSREKTWRTVSTVLPTTTRNYGHSASVNTPKENTIPNTVDWDTCGAGEIPRWIPHKLNWEYCMGRQFWGISVCRFWDIKIVSSRTYWYSHTVLWNRAVRCIFPLCTMRNDSSARNSISGISEEMYHPATGEHVWWKVRLWSMESIRRSPSIGMRNSPLRKVAPW